MDELTKQQLKLIIDNHYKNGNLNGYALKDLYALLKEAEKSN